MPIINDASQYRFRKGDGFFINAWSNVAVTLATRFRVVYDSGEPDDIFLVELATGSARALVTATGAQHVANDNGVVVGVSVVTVGSGVPQRGQCYVQAGIVSNPQNPSGSSTTTICACGYVYAGHDPRLGETVEPGPAGGHGATTSFALGNPAAGAEYASISLPAGALWKLRGLVAPVVAAVAAASRLFRMSMTDAAVTDGLLAIATGVFLTGETHTLLGMNGSPPSGIPGAMTGFLTIPVALSERIIAQNAAGSVTLVFTTDNINAGDDYGAGNLNVEEWVMPN